jgi:hypothetical protein
MDTTQTSVDITSIDNTGAFTGAINSGISDDTITLSNYPWTNTVHGGGYSHNHLTPNITVSSGSIGSNTYPYTHNTTGGPYTITSGAGTGIASPWATYTGAPKIRLDGEGADIEVNGVSLIKMLQEIQNRLNILQPNTALEAEWNELFELGKKYRELEQHIKDKQATWDRLKAMPPPDIE